ncbi:hypothetical protein F7725_012795 [Dissostichus mawsoni]|uniref:Uncharacterized protein n=1 Tax=Dissostichus mawsoni TaxID=36200 RepID=A0A7J5YPF6_DISMA|nr:hypothetical protein F7725_012795 [Dissostichus mawsoni]
MRLNTLLVLNCPVGSRALPHDLLVFDLVHCQSLQLCLRGGHGRGAVGDAVRHTDMSPVLPVPGGAVARAGRSPQGSEGGALRGNGRDNGRSLPHLWFWRVSPGLQEGCGVGHGLYRLPHDHPPAV